MTKAILGLGGHDRPIAAIYTGTVIRRGDATEQILNAEIHPEWQSFREKMVKEMPKNEKLWDKYAQLRRFGTANNPRLREKNIEEANAFFDKNEAKMMAGAVMFDDNLYNPTARNALHYAMNLKIDRGDDYFFSECQNEPLDPNLDDPDTLKPEHVQLAADGRKRGEVPPETEVLVAFIDVGDHRLHYMVCAIWQAFTGHIVDYGHFPQGRQSLKTMGRSNRSAILAGLRHLEKEKIRRIWYGPEGAYPIRICLVDVGHETETVAGFIEQAGSPFVGHRGIAVGPAPMPPVARPKKSG
jgi:hypothetical protein